MAAFTQLRREDVDAVAQAFGRHVTHFASIPAGSVNSNYRFVVEEGVPLFARVYEEQDQTGAEGEARLLDHLASKGVMTPRPLPRADGRGFTHLIEVHQSEVGVPHPGG